MKWTAIKKMADAIKNDVVSGLRGYHTNLSMSTEQLEQDIVETRLLVIKEYKLKGLLNIKDLIMSINCISVDCESLDKCPCDKTSCGKPVAHFEVPQILFDIGNPIFYLGSSDKSTSFTYYTRPYNQIKYYHKYRKRGKNKPWVFIDVAPNSRGFLDCYIFGAPLIKQVSISAVFKDPRQLEELTCNCDKNEETIDNYNFIDTIVKDKLTQTKLRYYRAYQAPIRPNTQEYEAG